MWEYGDMNRENAMETLYSVEEAARRLGGISVWTLYSWLSKKKLRGTKVGARTIIRESDLQAFLSACNPEPAMSAPEPRQ